LVVAVRHGKILQHNLRKQEAVSGTVGTDEACWWPFVIHINEPLVSQHTEFLDCHNNYKLLKDDILSRRWLLSQQNKKSSTMARILFSVILLNIPTQHVLYVKW